MKRAARRPADLQYHWQLYPDPNMKPNMLCNRCLVSGRVQGVFYRASAQQRAQELGVRGYARNLSDGRVEVLACGEAASVQAFVDWLIEEAKSVALASNEAVLSSPPPAAKSAGARPRARSAR